MTIAAHFWRRQFKRLPPAEDRLFETEPGTRVRAACHWQEQPRQHPTLVVLHGLEGSSDSGYMRGTAERAWRAGCNVVRLNQRNCGGTEDLSPTIYHSGLSVDIRSVIAELIERDRLPEIFAAGFSMGGNLVLKMAGEWAGAAPPELRAVAAVAPSLDLASCADALGEPRNFLYQRHFVRGLKARIRRKAQLFPGKYRLDGIDRVRSVRDYDDVFTAPHSGFRDASEYYARASAGPLLGKIARPTMILAAEDDPFVPFRPIAEAARGTNPLVVLAGAPHGGHCAFISSSRSERFWAEARLVEFFAGLQAQPAANSSAS